MKYKHLLNKIKQNKMLSSHVKIILEELKTYRKDAVILCGGYGRSEGGLFREYIKKMSFKIGAKSFFGTIVSVLKQDIIVECGTGTLKQKEVVDANKLISTKSHYNNKGEGCY